MRLLLSHPKIFHTHTGAHTHTWSSGCLWLWNTVAWCEITGISLPLALIGSNGTGSEITPYFPPVTDTCFDTCYLSGSVSWSSFNAFGACLLARIILSLFLHVCLPLTLGCRWLCMLAADRHFAQKMTWTKSNAHRFPSDICVYTFALKLRIM